MEKLLSNKRVMILISGVITVLALLFFTTEFFSEESESEPIMFEDLEEKKQDSKSAPDKNTGLPAADIFVDIKGAVKKPGVYQAEPGERVIDLINKAGSFKEGADQNKVNLAQAVADQMVIFVPLEGEQAVEAIQNMPADAGSETSEGAKVNINTATEEELQTLTGIGPSKAAAILEFRKQNGGFKNADDLKKISGIGDKTFEKIKDRVLVQ
ncbi:helix-hairpin-helix domain-containing protein [Peribacillus deserti]|uniref:Competence protein ComEA n=1 Tax=Peribacillus deserti TaxID=673318 RepID=A0A2N5M9B4_9BACI|nr:helix-hairpin-helix domain-containing protein [Peribacillus deserti]PLT30940.1 competence protein ComEA [Peribacillus deserti]